MTVSASQTVPRRAAKAGDRRFHLQSLTAEALAARTRNGLTPGIAELRRRIEGDLTALARAFVDHTLADGGVHGDRLADPQRQPAPVSIRNRRRRAARLWLNAIVQGKMDRATLDALTSNWLPPLAGVGHQRARALPHGERYIEWIRGAMTAAIFSDPADNLVPHAYALHALETVLSVHLGAIRVKQRRAAPRR